MFILTLHDRNGKELALGDIVKVISSGSYEHNMNTYAEVKWLREEHSISPFHTFSFHEFEKVDKLPDGAVESKQETRYKIWFVEGRDYDIPRHEKYLLDWRSCEYFLEERIFRIRPNPQLSLI